MEEFDAIVVGARVAGAPTAMLLARRGHSVLLLDRATFPSDVNSTHMILTGGVECLRRWGLLDRLLATGCPPINHATSDFALLTVAGPIAANLPVGAICPRRYLLDPLLADAAAEAGALVRLGVSVHDLTRDVAGRVNGVRWRDASGATVEARARIVVGADGVNSFVARAVDACTYDRRPGTSCGYYSYWSGIPDEGRVIHMRDRRIFFAFPTHAGRTCIVQEAPAEEFAALRGDLERRFDAALDLSPWFAERVRAGRREERFAGFGPRQAFFRQAWGLGWALVGDAGCYKDPVTGSGISDAFRDAELLAVALHDGLSCPAALDEALAGYAASRDAQSRPGYEAAALMSSFTPLTPAYLQRLCAALGITVPEVIAAGT